MQFPALILAALLAVAASDCDVPPIAVGTSCDSAACPTSALCGGNVCNDFSAGEGESCQARPEPGWLPSPGCRPGLSCEGGDPTEEDRCVRVDVAEGGACGPTAWCAWRGMHGVPMECVDGVCEEFGFVGECVDRKCPGGIRCTDEGVGVPRVRRANCVQRARKGEVCKGGRYVVRNGFECQYDDEAGAVLLCVGGVCQERVEIGGKCGEGFYCTGSTGGESGLRGKTSACEGGVCVAKVAE